MNNNNSNVEKVKQLVALKKEADTQMFELESKLLGLENDYLSHVNVLSRDGSILKGVDGYLGIRTTPSTASTPNPGSSRRRSGVVSHLSIPEEDRVFTKAALVSSYHRHKDSSRIRQPFSNTGPNYSEENGANSDADLDDDNPTEPEEGEEEEQYTDNLQQSRSRNRKK